jgi:hypothetical protein
VNNAALDGAARRDEGLSRHLATEDTLTIVLRTQATEEVDLDRLQVEEGEQIAERVARRLRLR